MDKRNTQVPQEPTEGGGKLLQEVNLIVCVLYKAFSFYCSLMLSSYTQPCAASVSEELILNWKPSCVAQD